MCLNIGLVNNMPDGALEATERQFQTLLSSAANSVDVRLSLFALPEVPRTEDGRRRIDHFYSGIEDLWDSRLDGLIVTGAEPLADNLADEPYWANLTRVLEWAEQNTHSTILSCLAAHAAVQHMDGIGRRRLGYKRFGVFEYARVSDHQLMSGIPARLKIPHSRWNDVPEDLLTECGYTVLTRAEDGDVDAFVKKRKSLFVLFQGHPEYKGSTLLFEYRRDIGRYLRGERHTYPVMPEGCFDHDATEAFTKLRRRALTSKNVELLDDFLAAHAEERMASTWFPAAVRVYGNWLAYLCSNKIQRSTEQQRPGKHVPGAAATDLALLHAKSRME